MPHNDTLKSAAANAMRKHGFLAEFPDAVVREIGALQDPGDRPPPRDVDDLRELPWSSIDDRHARQLDQVEVAERLANGAIRIRIAVADVESLVRDGSNADDYAAANTTSVYTGVVVFPLFPERLSSDLTSLKEGDDRLAMVVSFDVDENGLLGNPGVSRAMVRNHAKLSYDEVAGWLHGESVVPPELAGSAALRGQILMQDEAAKRLRSARAVSGALDFESVEPHPVVVRGRVVDIAVTRSNRARDMIEDFMVAANRSVAMYLIDRGLPSIRRVVREPRRWDRIVALARDLSDDLPDTPDSEALAEFLVRRREADPEHFGDLSLSVVKLLGPGEYVLERRLGERRNAGHFGMGVADYVHSTAPNRRFADLVTQRLLRAAEENRESPYSDDELIAIASHCTERSDAARRVERTMRKVVGAAMLADHVGESFPAVVTAASPKGTYARLLDPPIEGRVTRGERGLDVGDTVRLTLIKADAQLGYIDFERTSDEDRDRRKRARSSRKKQAANRMRPLIGRMFDAEVTGVVASGTWVRLLDGSAEGRVVSGYKPLKVGMRVPVRLIKTNSVHGFIDFEYDAGVAPAKSERLSRKREAARRLRRRIGDVFRARVTGNSPSATWIVLDPEGIEGRLVRGRSGLSKGDELSVVLLRADAERGFIDFAREED